MITIPTLFSLQLMQGSSTRYLAAHWSNEWGRRMWPESRDWWVFRHIALERMQSLDLVSIYNVHFGGIQTIHKSHYTAGAVCLEIWDEGPTGHSTFTGVLEGLRRSALAKYKSDVFTLLKFQAWTRMDVSTERKRWVERKTSWSMPGEKNALPVGWFLPYS